MRRQRLSKGILVQKNFFLEVARAIISAPVDIVRDISLLKAFEKADPETDPLKYAALVDKIADRVVIRHQINPENIGEYPYLIEALCKVVGVKISNWNAKIPDGELPALNFATPILKKVISALFTATESEDGTWAGKTGDEAKVAILSLVRNESVPEEIRSEICDEMKKRFPNRNGFDWVMCGLVGHFLDLAA
jgi:hypothetical protein